MTLMNIRLSKVLPWLPGFWLAAALAFGAQASSATSIDPVFVAGNPACTSLGYDSGFKIDPPAAGTYSIDGINTVTVTTDGIDFDWSSTLEMDAVISKGGPNANVYIYDPSAESAGDTALHSPINPNNGKPYGLSHMDFCFDYEVKIGGDAHTSFTRSHHWSLGKSVTPETWSLFSGDTGTSIDTVAVQHTGYTDSDWTAAGTITIRNPSPLAATLTAVTVALSPEIAATVDCGVGFPYSLGGGETLECSYQAALPDGSSRVSRVTVTTSGIVESGTGTAAVEFGAPSAEVNASVDVTDSIGGAWKFRENGTVSYPRAFACNGDQGAHGSVATIVQTGQSAADSVAVRCYGLELSRTVRTSLTRNWSWSLQKSADQTELTLMPGQQLPVQYRVSLAGTPTDSDWEVRGTLTVGNPNPYLGAVLTSVQDLAGSGAGTIDCGAGFPYRIAPGGTLSCSYSANLPVAASRTATTTVTLQNFAYAADGTALPSGTTGLSQNGALVEHGTASLTQIDDCVEITDSLRGPLGSLCADAAPGTFQYSLFAGPFTAPGQCGLQEIKNTATFTAGDTGATGESTATVRVHVACGQGCTLTPGYWKTHSRRGPAPYDDTWAELGPAQEATPCFRSGKSWYGALWTAPAGNAWYILAHAYMAASLNVLNGAAMPPEVLAGWNEATSLLSAWTPAQIGAQKGTQQPRKRFLELAGLLDMYNNGLIGPGHCSE